MKKIFILLFMIIASMLSTVYADIIPRDMKVIYVSTILANMDDYPNYTFVHLETLENEVVVLEKIETSQNIGKGYKFNKLEILAVPRELFKQSGGIKHLDLFTSSKILRSRGTIESGEQLVARSSDVTGKKVFYEITLEDDQVFLKKTGEQVFYEHPNIPDNFNLYLFLYALTVTLLVELLILFLLRKAFWSTEVTVLRTVLTGIGVQLVTLPLLWLVIIHLDLTGAIVILSAETFAVAVETILYCYFMNISWRHALIAAFLCNLASFIVGMMG